MYNLLCEKSSTNRINCKDSHYQSCTAHLLQRNWSLPGGWGCWYPELGAAPQMAAEAALAIAAVARLGELEVAGLEVFAASSVRPPMAGPCTKHKIHWISINKIGRLCINYLFWQRHLTGHGGILRNSWGSALLLLIRLCRQTEYSHAFSYAYQDPEIRRDAMSAHDKIRQLNFMTKLRQELTMDGSAHPSILFIMLRGVEWRILPMDVPNRDRKNALWFVNPDTHSCDAIFEAKFAESRYDAAFQAIVSCERKSTCFGMCSIFSWLKCLPFSYLLCFCLQWSKTSFLCLWIAITEWILRLICQSYK